jgi:ankyrin repeat protein
VLVSAGADLNIQNDFGNTALIEAMSNGHKEIVHHVDEDRQNWNIDNLSRGGVGASGMVIVEW